MERKLPFADLPPPPGGLQRLQARLDRRRAPLWWALAPALGAALIAIAVSRKPASPPEEPVTALAGSTTAVEQISGGPVVIYRVSSLE